MGWLQLPHHRGRSEVSNKKPPFPEVSAHLPWKERHWVLPGRVMGPVPSSCCGGSVEVIGPTNYHGTWNKPLGWTHGSDRKWLGSAGVFSPTYGTKSTYLYRGELTQLLSTSRTSRHGSGKYISYTWAIQKKILNLNWFGHLDRIPNAESYILRWPTGGNRSL